MSLPIPLEEVKNDGSGLTKRPRMDLEDGAPETPSFQSEQAARPGNLARRTCAARTFRRRLQRGFIEQKDSLDDPPEENLDLNRPPQSPSSSSSVDSSESPDSESSSSPIDSLGSQDREITDQVVHCQSELSSPSGRDAKGRLIKSRRIDLEDRAPESPSFQWPGYLARRTCAARTFPRTLQRGFIEQKDSLDDPPEENLDLNRPYQSPSSSSSVDSSESQDSESSFSSVDSSESSFSSVDSSESQDREITGQVVHCQSEFSNPSGRDANGGLIKSRRIDLEDEAPADSEFSRASSTAMEVCERKRRRQ